MGCLTSKPGSSSRGRVPHGVWGVAGRRGGGRRGRPSTDVRPLPKVTTTTAPLQTAPGLALSPIMSLLGLAVSRLVWCCSSPRVKFLATFLARVNQHEAAVLANKFPNLHLYGCWWYCNNPSIIKEVRPDHPPYSCSCLGRRGSMKMNEFLPSTVVIGPSHDLIVWPVGLS
jgi:hypothetical protein